MLEHHANLTPDKETETQRLMAENWDAPIVFTTSVQLLNALFKGDTRSARRMHRLAKAVIVFDEIQTLPIKTVHLFNKAMNNLTTTCGCSVVLCTATQPLLHTVDEQKGRIQLSNDGEIMPDVSSLFEELERVEIIDKRQTGGLSEEQIAELVKEELSRTGSVLTIVNTKKSARDLFILCKSINARVFHLSTNQCAQHRLEKIDMIRELAHPASNTPVICISTQLIEAGVDVDFGSVIRYVAGLDSIAQAAGRCNRSGKRKNKGRVLIVNPAKEAVDMLPEIRVGKEIAERVLNEFEEDAASFSHSLLSPQAIGRFFDYYFYSRSGEMDYPVSRNNAQDDTLLRMLSTNCKALRIYKNCSLPLVQSFATAGMLFQVIDSPTQGVIVPHGEGENIVAELCASSDIGREKDLLRKAQRYTVNCHENTLRKLYAADAVIDIQGSGILYLLPEYYSAESGLSEQLGITGPSGIIL